MLDLQPKISTSSIHDRDFTNRLNNLDLEPIIFRVMHMEETRWSLEKADRVAETYRCFLYLVWKYPGKVIVPNKAVDQFWHQHILDTEKYHQDSYALFGYFLHHFPYFGMRGETDVQALNAAFEETLSLLKEQFEDTEIFGNIKASDCLFGAKASDCLFVNLKSHSADNQLSDCLFGAKASDCLFVDLKIHSADNQPSDYFTKNEVDMSRPRPIRK